LRFGVARRVDQFAGRFSIRNVHLIADFAGVLNDCDGVAVILRGHRKRAADADIVGGQRIELFKLCLISRASLMLSPSLICRGSRGIGAQAFRARDRRRSARWRDASRAIQPHICRGLSPRAAPLPL